MGELEQHILQNALGGLIAFEWIRLIDDIFAIWSHRTDKLMEFLIRILSQISAHSQYKNLH